MNYEYDVAQSVGGTGAAHDYFFRLERADREHERLKTLKQRHAAPKPPYLLALLAIRFPPVGGSFKTKKRVKKPSITHRTTEARLTGR